MLRWMMNQSLCVLRSPTNPNKDLLINYLSELQQHQRKTTIRYGSEIKLCACFLSEPNFRIRKHFCFDVFPCTTLHVFGFDSLLVSNIFFFKGKLSIRIKNKHTLKNTWNAWFSRLAEHAFNCCTKYSTLLKFLSVCFWIN